MPRTTTVAIALIYASLGWTLLQSDPTTARAATLPGRAGSRPGANAKIDQLELLALLERGDTADLEALELAARLDPADESVAYTRDWLSASLVRAGCDLEKQGKYDAALERFDAAARIDPNGPEVHYRRGRTLIQKGQLARARQDMERAIELRPGYFDAYQTLDWLLAKEGRWDDVIVRWNQFIALEPNNANAYLERAGSHRHKGDMRAARADLKSACDLGNGNACQILAQAGR